MAQSTNDAFPTAIHLATYRLINRLVKTMQKLEETFTKKGKEFDHIIKMGRTHMQDAVPIRLGQEFQAYGRVLARDMNRVRRSTERFVDDNLGANAGGTGLNADPLNMTGAVEILAELTDNQFENAVDLVDATQSTDAYTEVSSSLKICMMNMSKV